MYLRPWIIALLYLAGSSSPAPAQNWLFVSLLNERTIVTFQRDPETGELSRVKETSCPEEPAFLNSSTDGRTLFVAFRSSGQLASFRIDPESGGLELVNVAAGGADPAYLQPDRTGRFLISAYYVDAKVTVHGIDLDGRLSNEPLQTLATAEKAHAVAFDGSNRFVWVPHTGANRIYQFLFSASDGRLAFNQPPYVTTPAEDEPRHIAWHPSGRWVYTSNEAGDSIGVFEVQSERGTLRQIQVSSTLPEDFDGRRNSTARCEMTRDGRFVYVANRGHDSLACFAIDASSGLVSSLGQVPTEQTPRSFTIEPRQRYLYAAGQDSGRVATYRIEPDGTLTRIATTPSGPVSWCVLAVDSQRTPGP